MTPTGVPVSVAERFRSQAQRTPDAIAVECGGLRLRYAELDAWVDATSVRLQRAGVGPEWVAAVIVPRSPALVVSLLAINRAGGVYLPIDPELPAERIDYIVSDARPRVVVGASNPPFAATPSTSATPVLVPSQPERRPAVAAACPPGPDDRAVYLIYTSGSTGRPKGVVMGTGAVANMLDWHCGALGPGPGRRVAQFTAIGFDIAAQEIFSSLISGATLVIPPDDARRDPLELARWLDAERITDLFCPNVVLVALCEEALAHGYALSDLSHIAQAGEQLTITDAVRDFVLMRPGRQLHNHYGPTETHAATSWTLPPDVMTWPDRAPIGAPIPAGAVHLLDENLRPVSPAAPGEVYVSGVLLARGYHGRPALTAERFLPCPAGPPGSRMYRTGDIARRQDDGLLVYLGRADDQVKVRGVRVELGEVEAALTAQAGIAAAAVVARPDGRDTRLDAYIVPAGGEAVDLGLLRTRMIAVLAPEMIPATFTVLAELPKNSNGKLDRAALPDPTPSLPAGPSDIASSPPVEPPVCGEAGPDQTAAIVARLFSQVLLQEVGLDDDFIRLGGHSLSAAVAVRQIRRVVGLNVTAGQVLRLRTARAVAAAAAGEERTVLPLGPATPGEPAPASFAQERLWVQEALQGGAGVYNVAFVLRMTGPLDIDALRAAVGDVIDRHEALRTRLRMSASGVMQDVSPPGGQFPIPVHEVDPADVAGRIRAHAGRPFDLEADLPVRAAVYRCGPDGHSLCLAAHHVAVDGWSVSPLMKDLGFAYAARRAGFAPPWRSLPIQYQDFARWQRERLACDAPGTLRRRLVDFWRPTLATMPEVTGCRTDHPRPTRPSGRGRRIDLAIDATAHRHAEALALREGCTVFMVVHAALALLLREHGAGDDVAVGAAVGGRLEPQLDDVVGLFVDTVVLRTGLGGDPTLAELLDRVREADVAAIEHQELPFEHAVEMVNPTRSLAYSPLVQIMLAFQAGEPKPPTLPGLETALIPCHLGGATFDLTWELAERFDRAGHPDGIHGHLEYSTDLFEDATAGELASGLQRWIRELGRGHLTRRLSSIQAPSPA